MKNLQNNDDTSQVLDPFALASLTFDEEQGRYVAVPEERPDLLTMKYPAMADRIKAVRAEDFSDKEIERMISDNIALAEAEGYTPEEIDRYYGITPESKSAVWEAEREKEIQLYAAVYSEPRKKVVEDLHEAEALGISYVHLRRRRELEASPETEPPFVLHVHERAHERVQPDNPVGDSMLIRTIGGLTVGFSGALSGTFRGINWLTGFNWADEAADNLDETMRTFQKEHLNGDEAGFYDSVMQGIGSTGYFLLPGTLAAKGAEKIGRVSPFLGRIFGASTSAAVESLGEAGSVYKEVLTRTGDEVSARGAASMTFWLNIPTNFISDKLAFFGEDEVIKGLLRRTGLFARASDRIVNAAGYLLRGIGGGVAEGIQETMQGAISEHYGKGTPWGQLDLLDILYEEGMPAMVSGAVFGMAGSPKFADAIRKDVKGEQEIREKESARTVYDRIVEQATAAGRGEEEAKAAAAIWSARALVRSRQEGITAEEWFEKTLTGIEGGSFKAENGESYTHPVNAGVDLGQKVPILDLSGMEGTSTPKELLVRLKDMALKDEAWISRDAEVFATLPRGKKLKHVAYSSRMPGSREARALRSNIASGLDELVQNAVLIESMPNNDPKKTDILNFHRLYVPVRTDAGVQAVRIVAEELKGSDSLKPTDVELYDVVLEGQKESPAVSHGLLAKEVVPSPGAPFEVTIADMLRGVKDAEGNPYVGEEYEQSAYHGSPHRGIKKMSLQHIGTGDGGQAFGYGVYSAQARGTAEFYREALTKGKVDAKKHVVFSGENGRYSFRDGAWSDPDGGKVSLAGERVLSSLADGRLYSSESLKKAVARYKEINAEDIAGYESEASELREEATELEEKGKTGSARYEEVSDKLAHTLNRMSSLQEELDWLDANPLTSEEISQPNSGQLYRLEVPENDVLLDWDKPISEQPEKVKTAIREIAAELTPEDLKQLGGNTDMLLFEGMTGQQLYAMLAWLPSIGSEKDASMLLLKHGVPGLRYLDALSRGKGEGTHNFVVWDEDAMSIEETYYQIIGRRGAEALDAAEEGTTRLDNLSVAREMEQAGKDVKSIRLATGWERGADGKWRYEIPDGIFRREGVITNPDLLEFRELEKKFIEGNLTEEEQSRLEELKPVARQIRKPSRLSDFYDAPELYAAYPELADVRVKFQDMEREKKGAYSPAQNVITLNAGLHGDGARTALIHEIQHAIQDIEWFAYGGNLKNGGKRYHRLAGETEARNAERRTFLTDKERRERLLAETEDVAREDQIVLEEMMAAEMASYQGQAEAKLAQDEKTWAETVDSFMEGKLKHNRPVRVMTTPIALQLAADEEVDFKEIVTSPLVLKKILKDKHIEVTPKILKQLPRAMADPIMVFKSATTLNSYVSMLELKDERGGTVVVPVALNASRPGEPAFMTSAYGKSNTVQVNDQWFAEQINAGNLRYMNTKKSASWAEGVGHQLPIMPRQPEALHEFNIPTEADLVKARFENPGFYQDERQQAPRGAYEAANRIIRLFESADASTLLHETGHAFLDDFARFIKSGRADIQVQADWSALMEWLGSDGKSPLTREQHEQFARGFEAYLLEGRAPSLGLRNVFEQFKNWLIGIYRGVEELNVTLSDEVRGVFDRMLATEGEIAENRVFYQDKTWNVPDEDEDAGLPPDDEQDWPNREAYMNAEEVANRIADGDESALFDPEWFSVPEDSVEGMEKVDGYQQEEEGAQIEAEAYEAFRQFAREIVEQGGIRYEDIVAMLGKEAAAELRKKLPYVFRRTTTELGKLAQALAVDPEQLVTRLWEAPKKPQQLEPVLEVDQETYPWIVERMGVKGAYDYLKRRLRAVEADRKAAEEAFEGARDSGADEDELQMLRNNAWETYRERGYIRDSLETLGGSLRDDTQKSALPVSQTELNTQATVSAARWVQKTVKEALAEVTGSTKIGDLVTEYEAYRRAMKMVQVESRRAFSAGRKDAMLKAALRRKELKRKKAERDKERGKIRRMVEEMNTATRGEVLWDRKNEIRELLEGYEFKRRNAKTLYDLQGKEKEKRTVASVRRELKEYVGENPDAALNPDDLAVLDKRTLDTMMLDELTELHGKVMKLRADGILELEVKKAERQERLDRTREELYKAVGGRLGNLDKLVNPRIDTRGRKESFWDKVRANSQMMTRILDFIDGYKDFKGKWYKTFYEPATKAEDAFLIHKNQRFERMKKVLEVLNLDERQLGRVFYATQDPMSGIEKSYTLDECIHIYAGWFNERNRDAIMYGNGIDEAMAADIFSRLSDRHKALGKEVMQEFETHRQRYNDALVEYGNVGLIPEPNYLRMYRSNWTDTQGKSIDEGLEGVQNEIIRANGLRKLYADKSSSISRKVIKAEHQQPITLGILTTWQRAVQEQEHFIAYGALVKDLHALLNEPSDRITAGMQETINNRFGREIYSKLEEWVSRLAVPDFYKGYKAIDQMPRKLRSNAAAAYLTFNIMSALKQPTSLALYLRYASPKQMILSIGRFVASPRTFIQAVQELDPQVKEQQIDRFLEELKATAKSGDSRYNRLLLKTLQIGAKPILWFDMFVRCIGWDAVFNTELEKGATTEEARQRAQLAMVNTQNSVSPKDLPAYMASNEWLNLLVVFQNQGAKIWGAMTHDLYGDIKTGRVNEAFAGFAGLAIGAFLLSCLNKGDLPDDPEEALKWTAKEITGNIPLFGSGIVSGWEGFSGGSMLDTVARDIAGTFTKIGKGDFDDVAMNIYSAWSLAYGGTPVTVIRRALKAAKTGNPWELIGLHNRNKRKKALIVP